MEEKNNNFFTMLLLTIDETCPVFEMMDRIKKKAFFAQCSNKRRLHRAVNLY